MDFCSQIWSAPTLHSCVFRVYLVVLVCLFSSEDTEASHHITISLQPSSATKGDDVQITCEHDIAKYSSIHPRIDVDGQPHGEDTLSSIKGYNLTSSPYSNGVLVLTLHNVTRSHNGTTFECYYRHRGTKIISSGTATLWVREKAELKSSSSKYEFSTDTSSRQESFSQLPATTSIPVNITFIESFSSSVVMANSSDSHPVNVGGIAYSGNEHASESGLLVGVIAGVGVLISALLLAIVIFSMCLMFRARSARRDRKERDRIIKSMREPSPPVLEVKVQAIQPYSTVTFKDIDSNKKNDETNEGKSSTENLDEACNTVHSSSFSQKAHVHLPQEHAEIVQARKRFVIKEQMGEKGPMYQSTSGKDTVPQSNLCRKGYEMMESTETLPKISLENSNEGSGGQYVTIGGHQSSVKRAPLPTPWDGCQTGRNVRGEGKPAISPRHSYEPVVLPMVPP